MKEYRSIVDKIRGPLVPVMPAFNDDESLDLDSTCRWVDWLVESGIRLFWTTYGTSHYMSLTDAEIVELNKAVACVTRGRAVFIASTGYHWPLHECIKFLNLAADCGIDVVKLQIDWRWEPDENSIFNFYSRIAEVSPLPLFAYTAPGARTGGMTVGLLKRILDIPQFVGMKNDSGDFYEHCDYLRTIRLHGSKFTPLTGGSMMSFLHGINFGARAFATSVGIYLPQQPVLFMKYLDEGRSDKAADIVKNCEEVFNDFGKTLPCQHWSYYHTILMLCGHFKSNRVRFPLRTPDFKWVDRIKNFLEERSVKSPTL